MDAVFINKLKRTKNIHIEMNRGSSFLYRPLFCVAFLLLYLAVAVMLYLLNHDLFISILIAFLGVFVAFYPTLSLHIKIKRSEKQILLLYNEIPESVTSFYEDGIKCISTQTKGELELSYEKIKKIKQTKNLYLLFLDKKLVAMVDKNGFEKGACEEFEKFIISKAVNAKNKL